MAEYRKGEAREWAKDKMRGVANTITPTFTQDLRGVNERAIRHDVRKEIEYGFWGALMVAETVTTLPEYVQCMTWAVDEAKGKLRLIHHASFSTLEENIMAVHAAEQAGAELVLLSYPANFYPESHYDYFGPMIPRIFALIQQGEFDTAMELYWQIHPARQTNINSMAMIAGSNFIHRMLWKYQG
jgi:4-hydroxy-tetrahydrodipicolinate synthase